jgi:G patch domain-containing protein 1
MLLRKMGWRPGQGIGPRVTYDQLRKQDLQSSDLPVSAKSNELDEDDEARKHTFAPRDTKVIVYRPKENQFGLGYVPGAKLSEAIDHDETTGPGISCELAQISSFA